jgi:hypothetical protein
MKMILGMTLLKSGILLAKSKNKTYILMIIIGYIIGLSLVIFKIQYAMANNFSLLSRDFAKIMRQREITADALGYVGLICFFC